MSYVQNGSLDEQIAVLERQIEDLKRRWPAHSLKPALFAQLEELEDKLVILRQQQRESSKGGGVNGSQTHFG